MKNGAPSSILIGNTVDSPAATVFTRDMTTYKEATEIQPGDIVMFLDKPHLISRVDPPTEAGARLGCYGYARSDSDGWCIALYPGRMEVAS